MEKVLKTIVNLRTGKVVSAKDIELEKFDIATVLKHCEKADGYAESDYGTVLTTFKWPTYRAVEQVNENLIARCDQYYASYFFKK